MIQTALCFDDVLLVPLYSEIDSRKEIKIASSLNENLKFRLPIISSPMDTVTESQMAFAMELAGGFGIIHRYNSIKDQCELVREFKGYGGTFACAAIGVAGDYITRAMSLVESGTSLLCLDIAHGHHSLMRHALMTLKRTFGTSVHIMAGNIATAEAFEDLAMWGADSIRVGIGGGSICSTRIKTGHGVPTLQSILDCKMISKKLGVRLIADGGIKSSGDAVKSLAAGADFVMMGSMLAGTNEAPGEEIFIKGGKFKTYRGMASVDAQIKWRGHTASVEGVTSNIPYKGQVKNIISDIEGGITSGFSYSGAMNLSELQDKAKFITQTSSGAAESSTHISNFAQDFQG